ncbi:MAG: heat-inducible transcriptional repressor HrcA [Paracoccaceae bacterium]|nr:heat-inducible transcriptional repressor HrcA [Paracoccaceae bacterium]
MTESVNPFEELNDRSRDVFRRLVEAYIETGEPVGSRTLARSLTEKISAATVRNVMQDLEHLGLLSSPHVSAGRVPTETGLRLFVDSLLEVSDLSLTERKKIESTIDADKGDVTRMLDQASAVLSGLTRGAALVLAPKSEAPIKHIEFVSLSPDRALVVLVTADGNVENRLFAPPPGQTPSAMREAANFLNAIVQGRTLSELGRVVAHEIERHRQELDVLARQLVESGVAVWDGQGEDYERLIVRGQSNLIDDETIGEDLERIRNLFDDIERKSDLVEFLELAEQGDGVRVFIGSENKLFSLSGSSLVVSPYMNSDRKIIGAVGVIGPTRLNYGRIVPIVDYTAQLVGRFLSGMS